MTKHRIAIIGGDGIGPEVTAEAVKVVRHLVEVDAGGAHHLQGLGHHLGADPVTTDDPDPMGHCASSPMLVPAPTNERPPTEVDGRGRTPGDGVRYRMTMTVLMTVRASRCIAVRVVEPLTPVARIHPVA